jgi:hypothetical protein
MAAPAMALFMLLTSITGMVSNSRQNGTDLRSSPDCILTSQEITTTLTKPTQTIIMPTGIAGVFTTTLTTAEPITTTELVLSITPAVITETVTQQETITVMETVMETVIQQETNTVTETVTQQETITVTETRTEIITSSRASETCVVPEGSKLEKAHNATAFAAEKISTAISEKVALLQNFVSKYASHENLQIIRDFFWLAFLVPAVIALYIWLWKEFNSDRRTGREATETNQDVTINAAVEPPVEAGQDGPTNTTQNRNEQDPDDRAGRESDPVEE